MLCSRECTAQASSGQQMMSVFHVVHCTLSHVSNVANDYYMQHATTLMYTCYFLLSHMRMFCSILARLTRSMECMAPAPLATHGSHRQHYARAVQLLAALHEQHIACLALLVNVLHMQPRRSSHMTPSSTGVWGGRMPTHAIMALHGLI